MTGSLVESARRVLAIEIDPTLAAILKETASSRLHIVQKDVLQVDWPALLQTEAAGSWKVVANLPYAITGPAILKLLEAKEWLAHLTIMVQLEVAERLVAPPGSKTRGLLSVLVEAVCDARLAFRVPRTCFWPAPQVDSAVVTMRVHRPPLMPPELEPLFRRVVRGAFGTRRKTVANALAQSGEVSLDKAEAQTALEEAGLDPGGGRRACRCKNSSFSPGSWRHERKVREDPHSACLRKGEPEPPGAGAAFGRISQCGDNSAHSSDPGQAGVAGA